MNDDSKCAKKLYDSIVVSCKELIKRYKNASNLDVAFILNEHKIVYVSGRSEEGYLYLKFPKIDYNAVANILQKYKFISSVACAPEKSLKIKINTDTAEMQKLRNHYIYNSISTRFLNEAQAVYSKYFLKKKEKMMSDDERSSNKRITKDNAACIASIKVLIK